MPDGRRRFRFDHGLGVIGDAQTGRLKHRQIVRAIPCGKRGR